MNRHRAYRPLRPRLGCLWLTPVTTLGVCGAFLGSLLCSSAHAQPAAGVPVNSIPQGVKIAPAMSDVETKAIKGFLDYQIPRLLMSAPDATPAVQAAARDRLMAESAVVGGQGGQAFLEAYAAAINDALVKHANDPSLRTRLNMAIVVNRVASTSQSKALEPVIIALLKDPADAVCLWAMKAAGKVLTDPNAPPRPANDALLAAVTAAVAAHNFNGAITDEAYQGLQVLNQNEVAALMKIYTQRVALYAGTPPDEPVADRRPSFFLTVAGNWKTLGTFTPPQQQALMQSMCDLMALAGQHAVSPQLPGDRHDQLVELLRQTAAAILVVGDNIGDKSLHDACLPTKNWGPSTPPMVITSNVNAIVAAIKASPNFPGIKPAPPIATAASAP